MRRMIFIITLFFVSLAQGEDYKEFITDLGYKFYSVDGNIDLVSEYNAGRSSPYFSIIYKDLSPNNKLIFTGVINQKDDRNVDLSITHKDILYLHVNNISLVHNLGHYKLLYDPQIYDLNPDTDYKLDYYRSNFIAKYRPFNYPLHLRLNIEDIKRDGTIQKRFYGSRSFDPNILALPATLRNNVFSRDRQIGFENEKVEGAIGGLLGGVGFIGEISTENFSNKHKNSPDYLLNYPNINKSAYGLKLYSNPTGQLTWSLVLNRKDSKNHHRDEIGREGASVTQTDSLVLFTYYPRKNLKLSLKIGYTDRDQDNNDTIRFLNRDIVGIKDAVSFVKKTADFSGWYEVTPTLIFKLNLKRKEIERNLNYFNLPEYAHTNTGTISMEEKFKNGFSYKISQKVESNHNPTYKKIPELAYTTSINLNYDINNSSGIYFQGEYISSKNDEELAYFVRNKEYKYYLNYWLEVNENLLLNLYGFYNNEKFISNIQYGNALPTFIVDKNVPFTFTLYQAGLNVNKTLTRKSSIYTDISYIRGYGTYYPRFYAGTVTSPGPPPVIYTFNTVGLDTLAYTDFYQYGILLGNTYEINKRAKFKIEASIRDHIDKSRQSIEGTIKTVFVSWELKW